MRRQGDKGFTLIEVMLATLVMVAVLHATMTLTRSCNYTSVKARIDSQVGSILRYEVERTLHMPYSNLSALAASGGTTSTGFLYKPLISGSYANVYPYTVSTVMVLNSPNTANENVLITTSIQWQEPSPNYSQPDLLTKTITTGNHTRRKF